MAINVYIPTPFRDLTAGQGRVQADGESVGDLIADLERRYPGLAARICEGGRVRLHVNVFVNRQEMRCLQGEATGLQPGDEVAFIPALVGGCGSHQPASAVNHPLPAALKTSKVHYCRQ